MDPPSPRPELGFLGLEKRRLPHKADYPDGLYPYQAMRVNRLIMETILTPQILKRGKYLGLMGVLRQIFAEIDAEYFDAVWVYGHPVHQDWCLRLSQAFLAEKEVELKGANQDDSINWDAQTSQVWCKSLENWERYISIPKNK